jgi:drug/metabolite transporter (DMT)-like permease
MLKVKFLLIGNGYMKNFMLCLLNVGLLVCGQLLFKLAAYGKEISSFRDMIKLLFSPYMIAAITLYAGTTILWVYILTKVPLSYAHPIQALAFPLVTVCSLMFLKEPIPSHRWVGIGIIILGALVAGR